MKKYGDRKSGVNVVSLKQVPRTFSCNLGSDLEHRDPKDDLQDIETGKMYEAMGQLRGLHRQLMEDTDTHITLRQYKGWDVVAKLVKKRDPEFLQGKDNFFVHDLNGRRIPITEEEYGRMVGLKQDPEDVLNTSEIDVETIDHAHTAPMDAWDITYDATAFINFLETFEQYYQEGGLEATLNLCQRTINQYVEKTSEKTCLVKMLVENPIAFLNALSEHMVYSANYFMYKADRRLHTERAKDIATQIEKGITRRQLGAMIGPKKVTPDLQKVVEKLEAQAKNMPAGREKGTILIRAQKVRTTMIKKQKQVYVSGVREWRPLHQTERTHLWNLWREKELSQGSVQLMSWQFARYLNYKFQRDIASKNLSGKELRKARSEAEAEIQRRVSQMAGKFQPVKLTEELLPTEYPSWLLEVAQEQNVGETTVEDYEFLSGDWLETQGQEVQLYVSEGQYDPDNEILTAHLEQNGVDNG